MIEVCNKIPNVTSSPTRRTTCMPSHKFIRVIMYLTIRRCRVFYHFLYALLSICTALAYLRDVFQTFRSLVSTRDSDQLTMSPTCTHSPQRAYHYDISRSLIAMLDCECEPVKLHTSYTAPIAYLYCSRAAACLSVSPTAEAGEAAGLVTDRTAHAPRSAMFAAVASTTALILGWRY